MAWLGRIPRITIAVWPGFVYPGARVLNAGKDPVYSGEMVTVLQSQEAGGSSLWPAACFCFRENCFTHMVPACTVSDRGSLLPWMRDGVQPGVARPSCPSRWRIASLRLDRLCVMMILNRSVSFPVTWTKSCTGFPAPGMGKPHGSSRRANIQAYVVALHALAFPQHAIQPDLVVGTGHLPSNMCGSQCSMLFSEADQGCVLCPACY